MSQRKIRELALQMLFQRELAKQTPDEVEELFWATRDAAPEVRRQALQLFRLTVENGDDVDLEIESAVRHWRLGRLSHVDRNLLRLAVAEMSFLETPAVVVIHEAVEIAKRFGSEKSPGFVNGVLDRIRGQKEEQQQ